MNYYSGQYLTTQVTTASGKRLVIYLYDSAIEHIRKAVKAVKKNHPSDLGRHTGAALDIVMELEGALDFEASPELAARLQSLYSYIIETLALAPKENNPRKLRSCEGVLTTLANAWRHVIRGEPQAKNAAPPEDAAEKSIALAV